MLIDISVKDVDAMIINGEAQLSQLRKLKRKLEAEVKPKKGVSAEAMAMIERDLAKDTLRKLKKMK